MFNVVKATFVVISLLLVGCGDESWVEWDPTDNLLVGESFHFTEEVCYLRITPEKKEDSYSDIDIAIGRYISTKQYYLSHKNAHLLNYQCDEIAEGEKFTIVASYFYYSAWWLIDAGDLRIVILEDNKSTRSYMNASSLIDTDNSQLSTFARKNFKFEKH